MDKMNFSRSIYFKEFCEYVIRLSALEFNALLIAEKIHNEIEDIAQKQEGGFWDITKGDLVFIKYMKQLLVLISQNAKPQLNDLIANLLKSAYSEAESKVKVVFFVQESYLWPSFESVYNACVKDDRFVAQLVYIPFNHPNANKIIDFFNIYEKELGLPIIRHGTYSISNESPDIAFFLKPFDLIPMQYYIDDVDKVVRRCVYISYGMEICSLYSDYHFKLPLIQKAWRHVAHGHPLKENAAKHGDCGENMSVWGSPRADCYVDCKNKKETSAPEWQKKIKDRKTILWTPHHSIDNYASYLELKEEILSYFENNNDVFLIWRPHPYLFVNLINSKFCDEQEVDLLKQKINQCDNVLLDSKPDYRDAFYVSDAIITDGTTFLLEYLYTEKPILYTKKTENAIYNATEIETCVYVADKRGDVLNFLKMLESGADHLKAKRLELRDKMLFIPEGRVGEHIKENIYSELITEIKQEAR